MKPAWHEIQIFEKGDEYFVALFRAIDEAKSEIRIETYTFRFDQTGTKALEHLSAAVKRGVKVFLLADGLGSPELTEAKAREVREMGIRLIVYRRPTLLRIDKLHGRMHRKVAVFDERILFLGGLNIADVYAGLDVPGAFFDMAVRVEGPIARYAAALAQDLFERSGQSRGRRFWNKLKRRGKLPSPHGFVPRMELIVRDNTRSRKAIETAYRQAIRASRRSIIIAQAYFLPSHHFIRDLCRAARRGVRVELVLQGKAEHIVLRWAERSLYERLIRSGVCIYEYQSRLLHTKVAVVDSLWSTIGSSNLEPWSLRSNLEANLVIEDADFSQELERVLRKRLDTDCVECTSRYPSLAGRFIGAVAYYIVRGVFLITGGR